MSDLAHDVLQQAGQYWKNKEALNAGRLIFESLSTEDRPRWAASVLRFIVARLEIRLPAVDHVLELADRPQQWGLYAGRPLESRC
jgi:hypothetical protein